MLFILAKKLVDITNNGIIKCIYKEMRKYNYQEIDNLLIKYKEKCKDETKYKKILYLYK